MLMDKRGMGMNPEAIHIHILLYIFFFFAQSTGMKDRERDKKARGWRRVSRVVLKEHGRQLFEMALTDS